MQQLVQPAPHSKYLVDTNAEQVLSLPDIMIGLPQHISWSRSIQAHCTPS